MHIQTLWPQAIVVYPQGLNTSTPLDPAGTKTGWQGKAGEFGDRDLELFDAIVATMKRSYSSGQAPDLRDRILQRRSLQPAAVGRACEDDRGDRRGRRPARPLRDPDVAAGVSGRGGTKRHGGPVRRPEADDPESPTDRWLVGAGRSRAAATARSTRRSVGPVPVKTFIHPGGHVYPGWAPTEIVKFFKSHKQP